MDAFELSAKLALNSQSFEKGMKNAESGFRSFGSKLASLGGKAVSAYTAVTSSAIAVLGKKSVDAYAKFEQLAEKNGAVDTLFKKGADRLREYADIAYRTSGISANQYMETATSFAASLVNGLRGDTARAADLADMAMQDMSDNANKMGTDFDSIQHAYQGFAKQNFTMLDNLKLGYGGTKTEMQRLLKDAEKLTGKKYGINNFADIVEAIHAIQTEMGITGTTAMEAETTISGSLNMVKASWEDLLVAMTNPKASKGEAIKKFTDSVKVMLKNTLPAFKNFMSGLGDVISEIAPIIGEELPDLIAEFAPKFLEAGKNLMVGLGKGVIKAAQKIKWPTWNDVRNGVNKAWKGITQGVEWLGGLVFGKNEKGEVKWPDWNTVKDGALIAWDKIKAAALSLGTEFGKIVFGTTEQGEVNWPSWDGVVSGAKAVWDTIVASALTIGTGLGKIIFGTTEDGGVNWPTWDKITTGAKVIWETIVTSAKTLGTGLGKIVFGTTETGEVNWPTWDGIVSGAKSVWDTIVAGALSVGTGLGKIVFGTTENGEVNWPTWDGIVSGAKTVWDTIVSGALSAGTGLGKIIFGTTEDGGVNWPSWDKITSTASTVWSSIVTAAASLGTGLGKIVFGTTEDGGVNWPTWDGIVSGAQSVWDTIVSGAASLGTGLGKIIFGTTEDGGVNWPSWDKITSGASAVWETIVAGAKTAGTGLGKIIFGTTEDGGVNWPTWDGIVSGAQAVWDSIVSAALTLGTGLGKIVFGTTESGSVNWPSWDGVLSGAIKIWQEIIDAVKHIPPAFGKIVFGSTAKGEVNWPRWSTVSGRAIEIWNEIIREAGALKGLVMGDAADAKVTFDSILLSWSNLHDTIVGNAINIGTYFFDTGDPTAISIAIKGVADAIVPIAAALGTAAVVTNFGQMIEKLKLLFQLDVGYSKTAIILAGIAAAFTLVAQHWDDIKPVLDEIGAWFQEKIVKPVQEAIDAIKEFFGIKPPSGAFITEQKGAELLQMYKDWQNSGNIFGGRDQNKLNQFYSSLESAIKEAGYSEAEISRIMQDVRNPHSGKNAEDVINSLIGTGEAATGAAEEVNILQEALDGVTGDYPVNIPINVTGGGGVLDHLPNGRRKMLPKAKGDWSVPYDNFPALLHRNEMVLTASQARQYRDGTANSGLTAADVANIARSAVSNLTMEMNNETVGRVFGDSTTRRVNDNIMHMNRRKRYGYGG